VRHGLYWEKLDAYHIPVLFKYVFNFSFHLCEAQRVTLYGNLGDQSRTQSNSGNCVMLCVLVLAPQRRHPRRRGSAVFLFSRVSTRFARTGWSIVLQMTCHWFQATVSDWARDSQSQYKLDGGTPPEGQDCKRFDRRPRKCLRKEAMFEQPRKQSANPARRSCVMYWHPACKTHLGERPQKNQRMRENRSDVHTHLPHDR